MIKTGDHYLTRNGKQVRVICHDCKGGKPIVGLLESQAPTGLPSEVVLMYDQQGRLYSSRITVHDLVTKV